MPDIEMQLSNLDLEKAFISACFSYPERMRLQDLAVDDLYDRRHIAIFEALRDMDAHEQPINVETVHNYLVGHKRLHAAGGYAYLLETATGMNGVASGYLITGQPDDYAPDIADLATRRRTLRLAQDLARSVIDRSKPANQTINEYAAKLPRLVRVTGGAQHISVFASRYYDRLNELSESSEEVERRCMKTKILDLDAATGGFRQGEFVIIYGKPGLGKTKLVHQIGAQLAENNFPGAIYQMETSEEEIMDREFSREMQIQTEKLETANLDDGEWVTFANVFDRLTNQGYPLYLDFGNSWNTTTLRADLTRLKAERGIRWFVLDYLRFLTDSYGKDETERENHISAQLKRICRELELTGFVIHSMNKKGMESDAPELEHGSGGAGISFDCDKALFMVEHIPDEGGDENRIPNWRTLVFRKSRRKLKFPKFHLVAMKDYPYFGPVTRNKNGHSKSPIPAITHQEMPNDDLL
jgi:replicative DNA helicase